MTKNSSDWPVLTRYAQHQLTRIALPLGGIGTGTVSLGGRGDLRDWEIVNRPSKGFVPKQSFFAIYAKPAGGQAVTRAMEGAIEPPYEGADGCRTANAGLPRFHTCEFHAAYPFGQVLLSDPDVSLDVRIQAFNPLIPADADASGIPMAVLRFVLTNKTSEMVSTSVCGSVQNFIGTDGVEGSAKSNINLFQKMGVGVQGVFLRSNGVDRCAEQYGTMALVTTATSGVTYRTAWAKLNWGGSLLDFWDDLSSDGMLENREIAGVDDPMASLAVSMDVPPQGTQEVTFLLTWHFPNRQTWTPARKPEAQGGSTEGTRSDADRIGNYYTTQYSDALDVAAQTAARLVDLEAETMLFVRSLCDSELPTIVKEAALYNLSTLRTQTCFRTEDGRFYGWEGCDDKHGWCHGSCTHVWNYEQATAFLFGELACSMREVEFLHATNDEGLMSFRVNLPLERATEWGLAAADGQMGCIMKLYRDWQLSGNDAMLRTLWPKARKALEFCWMPGSWDADRDGVMEGCQHNTMDVEYYGPNPQMGFWYLGALRAAEEMALYLGETMFAATCHDLFEGGSRWIGAHLFNGEYFEHLIQPPGDTSTIVQGLRAGMGASNLSDPELQLGPGCLVDQLVGQYMAHVCGLGYLADPQHIRQTLDSVMRYNFRENLFGHFNHLRTFALNDEAALLMCTYPRGRRPKRPFPYYNEVMTGFEYTAAIHMLYEGQVTEGLKCITAIRARYDGRKRSSFDEAECGHHYARAMASWAAVLALSGFRYSGVASSIQFAAARHSSRMFWSNGYAWGICQQRPNHNSVEVELTVLHGKLHVQRLTIADAGSIECDRQEIGQGQSVKFLVRKNA